MKENGIRNAYLMAIAPTSSTSILVGTTAGIDPIMNKFFLEEKKNMLIPRVAPQLNTDTFWYYKNAHLIDQKWSVKAAGIKQRHVDQAMSMNLYITNEMSFSSSRVMNTCALSGQAAGIAASYLVKENKTTSCLKQDYNEVQKRLEDVLLIDKAAKDINQPTDFFVSSTISKVPGKECGSIKAEESEIFLTVPSEAIQNTSIVIDSEKDTNISIRVRKDILPHRFDIGYGKHKTVKLNKGRNIVSLSLFTVEEPSYLTLSFKASSLVSFPTLDENLPGFLMGNLNKPQYFNPFIILDDFSIYSKENLFNGYDRPYNGYNGWVSDQVECELKVKAKDFNQVNLYFDPSLERELVSSRQLKVHKSHMVDDIFSVANSLVKDFDLTVYKNNKPLETIEIRNNYQRLVKVNITEEGDSFAIKFLKTWNEKRIRLFSDIHFD